jgi:cobalt/nickel transport system permease protein
VKHSFIDKYSDLDSLVHRLDPRTRFIATLAFIVAVVLTPASSWRVFAFYLCLITALFIISRLPPLYVLKRSLVIFPSVCFDDCHFHPLFQTG